MKLIVSPAKKMRAECDFLFPNALPQFLPQTEKLLRYCRSLSLESLQKLLCCNKEIAALNYERFQKMDLTRAFTPALFAFDGIQYQYMAPQFFTEGQFRYIAEKLRILSGFYGVLRPFDGVTPYRLEMQAKVKTPFCRNLYDFWGSTLADTLSQSCDVVLNLASQEYAKAVQPWLPARIKWVHTVFGELSNGKLVEKGVYVKMARGEMVRYLAERQAETPEAAKDFCRLGYRFSPEHSRPDIYVFLRENSGGQRRMKGF